MKSIAKLPFAALFLLAGCAAPPKLPDRPSVFSTEEMQRDKVPPPGVKIAAPEMDMQARMGTLVPQVQAPVADKLLYSFRAINLPVQDAMAQFAQTYGLNIVADRDVAGNITVAFRDLSLDKALEAMLETAGLSWNWEDGLLRVSRLQTRTFTVDYLRLTRSGNSTTSASSAQPGGGGGGDGTTRAGLSRNDSINFWSELEAQLSEILTKGREEYAIERPVETTSIFDRQANTTTTTTKQVKEKEGRLVINRLSGTIQIATSRARMKAVERYLDSLQQGAMRQVYIDVKIVEVALTGDSAMGVDWARISMGSLVMGTATALSGTASGASVLPSTAAAVYKRTFPSTWLVKDVTAVLTLLKQQGDVRVVSQPRIRTLNNQAAIVRSGTERTFFTTTTTVTPVAGGAPLITTTNTPVTVTEGLVLSVTPQISGDGLIALDISPVVTKIAGVDTSPDGLSNAPRLDIKQASTMVRVTDGETIIIGGLIQEEESDTQRGVPGLADSPLGLLFRTDYHTRGRREMVVIMTPYIVR